MQGRLVGFTLVEMLVVIIIVSVLASIAVPKFMKSGLRAKEASLMENLEILRQAGDRCEADTGLTVDLTALTSSKPPSYGWRRGPMNTDWTKVSLKASSWKGPYLPSVPVNPITGNNKYVTGGSDFSAAWTHYTKQNYNPNYYFFPSNTLGSNGKAYKAW